MKIKYRNWLRVSKDDHGNWKRMRGTIFCREHNMVLETASHNTIIWYFGESISSIWYCPTLFFYYYYFNTALQKKLGIKRDNY